MMTITTIVISVAEVQAGRANKRALLRARLAEGFISTGFHVIIDANGDTEYDQIVTGDTLAVSIASPQVYLDPLVTLAALLLSPDYRGLTVAVPEGLEEWFNTAVLPFRSA